MATHDDDLSDLDFAMHDHHAEETDGQTLQRLRNRRDAMLRRGDDIRAHDLEAEIEALERGISVAQARQEMQGDTAAELEEARARIVELEKELKVTKLRVRIAEAAARSAGIPIGLPEPGEIMTGIDWGTGEPDSAVESTWQDCKLVGVREIKPAAPRPLAVSAEEQPKFVRVKDTAMNYRGQVFRVVKIDGDRIEMTDGVAPGSIHGSVKFVEPISDEEHAVETFLRSMVAAGYTIEKYTDPMTVEQAMERLHDGSLQQLSLRKGRRYATLNAGRLF